MLPSYGSKSINLHYKSIIDCFLCDGYVCQFLMGPGKTDKKLYSSLFFQRPESLHSFSMVLKRMFSIVFCVNIYSKRIGLIYVYSSLVLKLKGQPLSIRYHFKHKNGEPILLRSNCYSFQNPYTDEAEYIVCTNTLVK